MILEREERRGEGGGDIIVDTLDFLLLLIFLAPSSFFTDTLDAIGYFDFDKFHVTSTIKCMNWMNQNNRSNCTYLRWISPFFKHCRRFQHCRVFPSTSHELHANRQFNPGRIRVLTEPTWHVQRRMTSDIKWRRVRRHANRRG
jgi:hypothetical protein